MNPNVEYYQSRDLCMKNYFNIQSTGGETYCLFLTTGGYTAPYPATKNANASGGVLFSILVSLILMLPCSVK